MDRIEQILAEWQTRVDQIMLFTTPETLSFGNVNRVIARFRALAQFLQHYEPVLREWMMTYLAENRKMIFARWMTEHISRWTESHTERYIWIPVLYSNAKTEWDTVFGTTEFCFNKAEEVARSIRKHIPFENCDDQAIIDIHTGKEHEYDHWDGCWHCDDQERAWCSLLTQRMKQMPHPLLNGNWQSIMDRLELDVLTDWAPPHKWDYEYVRDYHDLTTYKEYLARERDALPILAGETMYQTMTKFVPLILRRGGWLLHSPSKKTAYDCFVQLWNTLDIVLFTIRLDIPKLVEFELD